MTKNARRIFELLDEYGYTVSDLCSKLGFKHSTVTEWISMNKDPSLNTINKFCEKIGITLSKFFSEGIYATKDEIMPEEYDQVFVRYAREIRRLGRQKETIPYMEFVLNRI